MNFVKITERNRKLIFRFLTVSLNILCICNLQINIKYFTILIIKISMNIWTIQFIRSQQNWLLVFRKIVQLTRKTYISFEMINSKIFIFQINEAPHVESGTVQNRLHVRLIYCKQYTTIFLWFSVSFLIFRLNFNRVVLSTSLCNRLAVCVAWTDHVCMCQFLRFH